MKIKDNLFSSLPSEKFVLSTEYQRQFVSSLPSEKFCLSRQRKPSFLFIPLKFFYKTKKSQFSLHTAEVPSLRTMELEVVFPNSTNGFVCFASAQKHTQWSLDVRLLPNSTNGFVCFALAQNTHDGVWMYVFSQTQQMVSCASPQLKNTHNRVWMYVFSQTQQMVSCASP
jgi:uncharacterized Zn-finger protein